MSLPVQKENTPSARRGLSRLQKPNSSPTWLRYAMQFLLAVVLMLFGWWWGWGEPTLIALLEGEGPDFITTMLTYHQSLDPLIRNNSFYVSLIEAALLRVGLMFGLSAMLLWLGWPALSRRWHLFLQEPVRPQALAVFRIICFGTLLYYPDYETILRMSALPAAVLVPPPGWHWILNHFQPSPGLLSGLIPAYQIAAVAALLGFRTRWTALATVVLGLWVLGIPQFYGKINHFHHLLWFGTLAAFAPVSQVWSVDSWRKPAVFNSQEHRYYLAVILLSITVIYFFAGWWKVLGGGGAWLWGDAARWQLETQALRLKEPLPNWLLAYPILFKWLGLGTVLLELSWGWWMLVRKSRVWILSAGLLFHWSIYVIMDINFWVLPVFYLVFLPFQRWFKVEEQSVGAVWAVRPWHWTRIYLALIALFGLLHLDSWPLAVYPSFGNPPETKVWQVSLEYYAGEEYRTVALVGDLELRRWLPKSRLMGLHTQLTGNEEKAAQKIELLDPFYCEALHLSQEQARRYVKRKMDLKTGDVLETRELWRFP